MRLGAGAVARAVPNLANAFCALLLHALARPGAATRFPRGVGAFRLARARVAPHAPWRRRIDLRMHAGSASHAPAACRGPVACPTLLRPIARP